MTQLFPESECLDRLLSKRMTYYRKVYKNSIRWNGEDSLLNKTVVVYCEQGLGDIIHFSRYFKYLKARGCKVILHCPIELHRLMLACEGVDAVWDKDNPKLWAHDYHVLSMSLPFVLGRLETVQPYIQITQKMPLEGFDKYTKIGIAWEGNPDHSNNLDRSCPLKWFKELYNLPDVKLFKLQKNIHLPQFVAECDDMDILGVPLNDFYDTATFINALDYVVSVDTSVLHLSGAMGKRTYGLLSYQHDYRWDVARWYSEAKLFTQPEQGAWEETFHALLSDIAGKPYSLVRREKPDNKILLTGGIGDVITLESYFSDAQREQLKTIYLATRAHEPITELLHNIYPHVKIYNLDYDFDANTNFAFYSKRDCTSKLSNLPDDWNQVADWSIASKFNDMQKEYLKYNGSSFVKQPLVDLGGFHLPDNYWVIVDYSPNDQRNKKRRLNKSDWKLIFKHLKKHNTIGVVLNTGSTRIEPHPLLIDLTNQTHILEAIEIVKQSKGYIGIDSCLSVIAAKVLDNVAVKSNNTHLIQYRDVYYSPKTQFKFITDTLSKNPLFTS